MNKDDLRRLVEDEDRELAGEQKAIAKEFEEKARLPKPSNATKG